MDFQFSPEELALQKEVRNFLKTEMPPQVPYEVEHEMGWEGPYTRAFVKKLGAKHWLTASWPKEYGGLGASYMQRYIIGEELSYFGGPRTLIGATMAVDGTRHPSCSLRKYTNPPPLWTDGTHAFRYMRSMASSSNVTWFARISATLCRTMVLELPESAAPVANDPQRVHYLGAGLQPRPAPGGSLHV